MDYTVIDFSDVLRNSLNIWEECDRILQSKDVEFRIGVAIQLLPEMKSGATLLEWLAKWQNFFNEKRKQFFILTSDIDQQECIEFSHPDLNLVYFSCVDDLTSAFPAFGQKQKKRSDESSLQRSRKQNIGQDKNLLKITHYPNSLTIHEHDRNDKINRGDLLQDTDKTTLVQTQLEIPVVDEKEHLIESDTIPTVSENDEDEKWNFFQSTRETTTQTLDKTEVVTQQESAVAVKAGLLIEVAGEYVCSSCGATRMYIKEDKAVDCENPECKTPGLGYRLVFELF